MDLKQWNSLIVGPFSVNPSWTRSLKQGYVKALKNKAKKIIKKVILLRKYTLFLILYSAQLSDKALSFGNH